MLKWHFFAVSTIFINVTKILRNVIMTFSQLLLEQLLYVKMTFLCCIYYIDQCYKDSKKCYNDLFSVVVRTVALC